MLHSLLAFLPIDRQLALANYSPLRARTRGAALFADLSGFTPLTEALVRALGSQRGAEELTRQLNLVYDALIGQVENYRGTVIGFSGDAITCWFEENNAPADLDRAAQTQVTRAATMRAIAAALAMQTAMQQFAAVPIPNGGTVALALKTAVVGGDARRFAVGDNKIQCIDVLAGSTLDRLADTEHHADKGEVVCDELTVNLLGDAIRIAAWKDENGERYAVIDSLTHPILPEQWERPAPGALKPEDIKSWLLPQVYARLASGQGNFLAELRPAVSLFMRFGGIDFEQDNDVAAKLDSYVKWVQGIIVKYDGILVQLTIGDKGSYLYAAFGAPIAHDDDAVRALHCALELHEPPANLNYITPPQIGVSRGRMRVGPYGGTTRSTYGVLGDEVNVAARLMQAATPSQILVTERVADVTERIFEFERLTPIRVKGKSEPLRVLALVGERDQSERSLAEAYALPLVGREKELTILQTCAEEALAGHGQVIVLMGEAGVGKSRLAVETMRRARILGFEQYASECPSYGTNSSYLVWDNIWRSFFEIDADAPIQTQIQQIEAQLSHYDPNFLLRAPLLGSALNISIPENDFTRSLDARVRKQLLESLLVDCVRAQSLETPLAFLLEDCHWLDALSHDLLEVLGRETSDRPVLIIITLRPPDLERLQDSRLTRLPNSTLTQLGDFSPDDAAELINLKLEQFDAAPNQPTTRPVIAKITARAGGNPFYIEELINYMRARGLDPRDPAALDALDLPDSLSSLILSRIDQLTETQRSTLKVASIIGRQFLFRWLWGAYPSLGDTTDVRTDLDDMSRLDLTPLDQPDPQRSYIFRHVLTQQVTYESTPYSVRAELHGHLGDFLEDTYRQELDRNVDLLAFHFDRSEQLEKRRAYLLKAGEQAQAEYANDAAISYYRRVLPLLDDTARVDVMLKLGQVYELVGQWNETNSLYRQGLELAEQLVDENADARCRAALGTLQRKRGEFADAAQWLDDALVRFEHLRNRSGIGHVLHERGTLAAQQGDYDTARAFYQESLAIRRELGENRLIGNLLSNLAILARSQGNYPESERLNNESLDLRREIGDRFGIAISLNNLGVLKRSQQQFEEARTMLQSSLELWREIGDRMNTANSLTSIAEVLIDQQDGAAARERLVESLHINRALGEKRAIAFLLENFARAAILENDAPRALKLVGAATALRQNIGVPLPAAETKNFDDWLSNTRSRVDPADAEKYLDEGKNLTLDEAVAFALE